MRRLVVVVATLLGILALPVAAAAVGGEGTVPVPGGVGLTPAWERVQSGGSLPRPRENAVLVYDPSGGRLYLHGGRVNGATLGDLWSFDIATGAWQKLSPGGGSPGVRFGHAAVFDERRGRLVLFGGQRGSSFFSDVVAYDVASNRWLRLAGPGAGPSARYGTCAGYDGPGDRFLVSHGFTHAGRFDDTWAFSLGSNRWTDVTPPDDRPVKRCLHACAFDETTRRFFLYGGQTDGVAQLGDLWVLAGRKWSERAGDRRPADRRFPGAAFVEDLGLLVFGGVGAKTYRDAWTFRGSPGRWRPLRAPGPPTARHSHAMTAAGDGAVYIFGGSTAGGRPLNDLWRLAPG